MVLHPAIIALVVSSLVVTAMVLYSAYYGVQILRRWDMASGSELQLALERRTYLISTILVFVFGVEILAALLYVVTADTLCTYFVGAMCAAGTLNVNSFGYPTLVIKILNFFLAGIWIIINYADNKGYDYPLIKTKYALLLVIAPLILTETILQGEYFRGLRADVITSCCGTLFSADTRGIASEMASLPSLPMKYAFFATLGLTLIAGVYFVLTRRGGYVFSSLSLTAFVVSMLSIISFISLYYYELPTHHCPFCVLQREYYYVGYPVYLFLFGGALSGLGVGALMPLRSIASLKDAIPSILKNLTLGSIISYAVFLGLVTAEMVFFSELILEGY
jgi:hypothetical protein